MSGWESVLVAVALGAAALDSGLFFAFSNFVMPALGDLNRPDAVRAMQRINERAPNPLLVVCLVGATVFGAPVLLSSWSATLLVGVVGSLASVAITMGVNVPLNERLAGRDPHEDADRVWHRYDRQWTRANTLRTLTSLVSVIGYANAL